MDRYRDIVDDWSAFKKACNQPAVTTVRKNPIKARENFRQALEQEFTPVERAEWNPDVFRLPGVGYPGKSVLHWRGEYYVQEESAAVPVKALDPRRGERVLDMCAAPGGKTTQIAAEIENVGTVVANDVNEKRLWGLQTNAYRTGCACVVTTNYDGRRIPEDEKYDRVLVDAPCTGEANDARRTFESASRDRIRGISVLQRQLALKASRFLRRGGVLVYSTCTFAPEENEGIVDHLLMETELSVEAVELDVPHQLGVTEFEGKTFSEELEKAVRIYPHHLMSGGMFLVRLRK